MKKNIKIVIAVSAVFLFSVLSSMLYSHTALFKKTIDAYTCPFKAMTGYPCATCGFTRCVLYTGSGHFKQAFFVSPLAFIIFVYLLLVLVTNLYFAGKGSSRAVLWPWKIKPQKGAVLLLSLLLLSWIYKLSAVQFY